MNGGYCDLNIGKHILQYANCVQICNYEVLMLLQSEMFAFRGGNGPRLVVLFESNVTDILEYCFTEHTFDTLYLCFYPQIRPLV